MEPLSLSSPLVVGALITSALKFLPKVVGPMLKKVDDGKLMQKYASVLHPLSLVLVFVASAIQSGISGNLASLDWDKVINFVNFYLPMLVGAKAMDVIPASKQEEKK